MNSPFITTATTHTTAASRSVTPSVLSTLIATLTARRAARVTPRLQRGLVRGATVWINQPQGCTVRCQAGTLWLTFDGEPQDVVLEAGDSHHCARASRLGIHAMTAARVAVE